VADTNIYVSAFNFNGTPARALDLAQKGRFRIAISEEILREINRILGEKFNWHVARLAQVRPTILAFAELVEPKEKINAVAADPDDNAISRMRGPSGRGIHNQRRLASTEYENLPFDPHSNCSRIYGSALRRTFEVDVLFQLAAVAGVAFAQWGRRSWLVH
jgi:hypothetical protein